MEEDQGEYPDSLLYHFPSQLRLDALPELVDISVSRILLTALLTALKANGKDNAECVHDYIIFSECNGANWNVFGYFLKMYLLFGGLIVVIRINLCAHRLKAKEKS